MDPTKYDIKPLGDFNGYPLNNEGEDLKVPLDPKWNLAKFKSGDLNIVLYGAKISPPCAKLRYILGFYGIPFENAAEMNKPGSEYKKMPVLDIGDRQVNDSYIIVKNLAPVCAGKPLTPREEELERVFTFELMVELERQTVNMGDLCRCGDLAGGGMGCLMKLLLAPLGPCVVAVSGQGPGAKGLGGGPAPKPVLKSLQEYRFFLEKELGTKQFFGGSSPGITDVSLAGTLSAFDEAGCTCMETFLGDDTEPLSMWHGRMCAYDVSVDY